MDKIPSEDPIIKKHMEILDLIKKSKIDKLYILFNEYHELRKKEIKDLKVLVDKWLAEESKNDKNYIKLEKIRNEIHDSKIEMEGKMAKVIEERSEIIMKRLNMFESRVLMSPRLSGIMLIIFGRSLFIKKTEEKKD